MSKFNLYYHGGSKNHGCEAIIRSTKKIIDGNINLYSSNPDEDILYGLDKVVNVVEDASIKIRKNSFDYYRAALSHKLKNDDYRFTTLIHKEFFDKVEKGSIYFSVGGDNYCYKGRDILGHYNKCIHKKGGKTILWGCSFDPADMTDEIAKDMSLYDLIVTRERISYDVLKSVNPNTVLFPDPAFQLDKEELQLPKGFVEGNTIGINLSPLVTYYADSKLIIDNYRLLVRYILEMTDNSVALIPHVVKDGNDDRTILKLLFQEFRESNRVIMIEDCNCMQLKGYISRCRMFVGARTHSTIAAYSTCVPTLVTGYSVKARGIAMDLFGTDKDYVIPVQKLKSDYDLTKAFIWLFNNEKRIRNLLNKNMPIYKKKIYEVNDIINLL